MIIPDVEDALDVLGQEGVDPVAAQVELLQVGAVTQARNCGQLVVTQVHQL